MERNYPKATITEKGERALRGGHPWVYADEVTEVSGEYENGGLADVFSRKGRYLGTGYINDNSKIRIRVISRNANDKFDRDFYARRIRYALTTAAPSWARRISAAAVSYSARLTAFPDSPSTDSVTFLLRRCCPSARSA